VQLCEPLFQSDFTQVYGHNQITEVYLLASAIKYGGRLVTFDFNLDHGTDFATYVDGVPVSLRTHGHVQGYTDIKFSIPEPSR
jgi:hypothetical protein